MDIWGGIECTMNRVGDRFIDQLHRSGHLDRPDDLNRIAELGIRKLRYPIHWERVQPRLGGEYNWTIADRQFKKLKALQIDPIAGLLHHGSGPAWTNLLDPEFPSRLAEYALAVATRFPHLRDYTPVNEPLTTARFSALYGHWYPHHRDDRSFAQALLNEVEGTIRAMRAIRTVRPDAHLIQTEDIGKAMSTSLLAPQAEFENQRRWLTFDLLCGRFDEKHPLWNFIAGTGISLQQLKFIRENPVPPDIFGVNYYVTSERWLDENLEAHPADTHGGNGRVAYADVAAVRACPQRVRGVAGIVREVWDRYGAPLAITESHLGCTREEQMRWLAETWRAARQLRQENVDLRAITVWALFGAFDWNSLVTCERGVYEPGAFDLRAPVPRATALARTIKQMVVGGPAEHPVLNDPGWWRRFAPAAAGIVMPSVAAPILILGGAGNLGRSLERVCQSRGLNCKALRRYEADACDRAQLKRAIEWHRPWAVINASGYTLVDDAETDRDRCLEVNVLGAVNAAGICREAGLRYVSLSSDLVFDGTKAHAYVESDSTRPLNTYGESKQRGEKAVLRDFPGALVIRTSPLFDRWSAGDFTAQVLLPSGMPLVLPKGRISPSYAVDLCHGLLDLLIDGESGIWHLANVGSATWIQFAEMLAERFQVPLPPFAEECSVAQRPEQSVLQSEKASLMPTLEAALERFHEDFQPLLQTQTAVAT